MYHQYMMIKIKIMNSQFQAFRQSETTPIQKLHHKIKGILQILKDEINLFPGKHNRYVRLSFGPDNALNFSKLFFQHMSEKEQQRIKGLILGRG